MPPQRAACVRAHPPLPPASPTGRVPPPSFFFSSRRRHTSSLRDWSSDVCSSDLAPKSRKASAWRLHGAPADPARDAIFARLGLWTVAAAAAALAIMIAGPHRIGDYFTETDFYGAYAEGARAIAAGRVDPARYGVIGPGYEMALALFGFAIHDLFLAAELISLGSIVAALLLWRSLLGRRAGVRV